MPLAIFYRSIYHYNIIQKIATTKYSKLGNNKKHTRIMSFMYIFFFHSL